MKHRTKQWLILLYTLLMLASVALCLAGLYPMVTLSLAWPEVLTLAFLAGEGDLTTLGMTIKCVLCAAMLLHVVAPVCGFCRICWPFKVLLGVKAVLNVAVGMLLMGWYSGLLVLLHGTLFVLAMIFFRRERVDAAADGEHGDPAPEEKRLVPSPGLHMPGSGFPDC